MITHRRSRRKPTGGLLKPNRKKKKRDLGRDFLPMRIGAEKRKIIRVRGGNNKVVGLGAIWANIADPKSGKVMKTKILTVKENPANPHYVRMNVITKGTIIETEAGLAKVTSRPGQHCVVNAVLIQHD